MPLGTTALSRTRTVAKESPSRRLFIAIEMPRAIREYCREKITQELLPLDNNGEPPSVKWIVDESMYHCTLQFLGSVDETLIPDLAQNLQTNCNSIPPFTVSLGNLGCFPDIKTTKNARVIWLGLKDKDEALSTLSHAVVNATEPLGFPREKRPFHAHVTLGRVRTASSGYSRRRNAAMRLPNALRDHLNTSMSPENIDDSDLGGSFQVQHVALIESVLSKQGPAYNTLQRFDLHRSSCSE
eukprot:scaffold1400_cov137-Cylindrotheca_fusiformis.AAC.3